MKLNKNLLFSLGSILVTTSIVSVVSCNKKADTTPEKPIDPEVKIPVFKSASISKIQSNNLVTLTIIGENLDKVDVSKIKVSTNNLILEAAWVRQPNSNPTTLVLNWQDESSQLVSGEYKIVLEGFENVETSATVDLTKAFPEIVSVEMATKTDQKATIVVVGKGLDQITKPSVFKIYNKNYALNRIEGWTISSQSPEKITLELVQPDQLSKIDNVNEHVISFVFATQGKGEAHFKFNK